MTMIICVGRKLGMVSEILIQMPPMCEKWLLGNHVLKKEGAKKVTFSLSSQNGHPRTTFEPIVQWRGAGAVNVGTPRPRRPSCVTHREAGGLVHPFPHEWGATGWGGLPSRAPCPRVWSGAVKGMGPLGGAGRRASRACPFRANGKGQVGGCVPSRAPFPRVKGSVVEGGREGLVATLVPLPVRTGRCTLVHPPSMRMGRVGPGVANARTHLSRVNTAARPKGEGEGLGMTGRGSSVPHAPSCAYRAPRPRGREAPGAAYPRAPRRPAQVGSEVACHRTGRRGQGGRGAAGGDGEGGVPLTSCPSARNGEGRGRRVACPLFTRTGWREEGTRRGRGDAERRALVRPPSAQMGCKRGRREAGRRQALCAADLCAKWSMRGKGASACVPFGKEGGRRGKEEGKGERTPTSSPRPAVLLGV
ncbi:hypothetical protein EDB89DRAFT_1914694 [Lactarius sanguifluus]|nr:hypothetical protein EDB89DRAFT_1914694 [Lactarius sanguifluus]